MLEDPKNLLHVIACDEGINVLYIIGIRYSYTWGRVSSFFQPDNDNVHFVYQAEEITLTIGQAFDLAYKRYLSSQSEGEDRVPRIERLVQSLS